MPEPAELVNMADQFKGLPIEDLIVAPIMAAAKCDTLLAKNFANFFDEVCLQDEIGKDGKPTGAKIMREVPFTATRVTGEKDGSKPKTEKITMSVPLCAIIPMPSFGMQEVTSEFEMEVKSSFKTESSLDAKAAIDLSVGWGPFSLKVHGEVASHSAQTRTSDNSAKYHIIAKACRQPAPEGLMKLMDALIKSATEPRAIDTVKPAA